MQVRTFGWRETRSVIEGLARTDRVSIDAAGRRLLGRVDGTEVVCAPPLALPFPERTTLGDWLADLPEELGTQCVLLLRAGASALGVWRDDDLVAHKVFRRYVVRGTGHAQPRHLQTKGKSRLGSRLRLYNARRLLEETNERLGRWHDELGGFDAVFVAAPVRMIPDLRSAKPPPPFAAGDVLRIPWHVHEPNHEELLRVRRRLLRGRIEPAP